MRKFFILLSVLLSFTAQANDFIKKVAVIDTGLDLNDPRFKPYLCKTGHKDFTGEGIHDIVGHGTHVVGSIIKYAKNSNYCIIILKFYSEKQKSSEHVFDFEKAVIEAAYLNVNYVNISAGGSNYSKFEYRSIELRPNTKFIVAAGNDGINLDRDCSYFPTCYNLPNVIVVGNVTKEGKRALTSNYGKIVRIWEYGENIISTLPNGEYGPMSGTSMSTSIATGKIIYDDAH